MLVIILPGITLKYSILCTFSWFLVKLILLIIKTAQLTVRGSLNRPPPRFSLQEPPRARFIPLLPYLYLLEIDQALTVAALLSCQATTSNLRDRLWKGRGRKEKVEGIGERGNGTSSPFPFRAILPLPSPPLACFAPATQFNLFQWWAPASSKKQKCLEPYRKKKTISLEKFLNSILNICETNYQTAQTPRGLPLNNSTFIITRSVRSPSNLMGSWQCSTMALLLYF